MVSVLVKKALRPRTSNKIGKLQILKGYLADTENLSPKKIDPIKMSTFHACPLRTDIVCSGVASSIFLSVASSSAIRIFRLSSTSSCWRKRRPAGSGSLSLHLPPCSQPIQTNCQNHCAIQPKTNGSLHHFYDRRRGILLKSLQTRYLLFPIIS